MTLAEKSDLFFVKDKNFYKLLFTIAVPVALQSLLSVAVNLADNVMVSSLGDTSFSSVAMANQFTVFLSYFIRGICGAASLMISQYWGKKDLNSVRQLFTVVLRFSMTVITIIALLVRAFPEIAMGIFVKDEQMLRIGSQYLSIVCFSFIFATLADSIAAMFRSVEVVKITFILTIISLSTNVFLNYCLIFGRLGFPALGVKGAAIATVAARFIEAMIAVCFLFRESKKVSYRFKHLFKSNKTLRNDFLRYGLPVILGDMQWGLVGFCKAIPVGRLGELMVAANSIAETIMSLFFSFTTGMANAACVIIGKSVGEGDRRKTVLYSRTIQILFAIIGIALASLLFVFRRVPVSFYADLTNDARDLAVKFLGIGAISLAGTAYHASCFTGINRGAGDTRFVFVIDLLCGWLLVVPFTFIFGLKLAAPLTVVYFCTKIDQFIKWIFAALRLNINTKWIKNLTKDVSEIEQ